ncbi:MAG: glycosyltransferase family 2 protein [Caldilineaceae bacterium]|nr:glycosyltransferase family 2 protein [Caldilineaceae bacterium]
MQSESIVQEQLIEAPAEPPASRVSFGAQPDVELPNAAATRLDMAIVIVSYNTRELLRSCLRSLFAQEESFAFQVCVVDNASPDRSAEMVRDEFPQVHLIANRHNSGYPTANNQGLCYFGFPNQVGEEPAAGKTLPRYALLLNPDTVAPPEALANMIRFMDEHPHAGVAGPRLRRLDGSLDMACRRSFPSPTVSFYRMSGLSRLFPHSQRFNAYNLAYLPEDGVYEVDSVVGAYMQLRSEAILQTGLLDESFFMYGEDLDWAKRIKDAGWQVWYNGQVDVTHVKEAASSQTIKSRIDFQEAMWIFYSKHYRQNASWLLDKIIMLGIGFNGGLDVARHLWRFCRNHA